MASVTDKHGLIQDINQQDKDFGVIFGAGAVREIEGYITVDLIDYPEVDIVGDLYDVLGRIDSGRLANVYASHLIEHIEKPAEFLAEVARVLRDGGRAKFIAPHFANPFFYSDPTHKSFFGLYSFCYLAQDAVGFKRATPDYIRTPRLELVDVKLVFRSYRPNYVRHAIFKTFEKLFNASRFMQELYEEVFSHFIGCYEVHYLLRVKK